MAKTLTKTVYTFDELDENAKEKAREWYKEGALQYEWWYTTLDDAKSIGKIIGIEIDDIYFSGFASQGDGACFTGTYSYRKGGFAKLVKECPEHYTDRDGAVRVCSSNRELIRIVRDLQALQRKNFYRLEAAISHSGHYYHSYCTDIQVWSENRWNEPDCADDFRDALRAFMDWIYDRLREEYEYLLSDEQVDESILANEYTFDEWGNREY